MTDTIILIDISDWQREWLASGIKPKTKDDLLDALLETQMKPMQLARLALTGRQQGKADEDILAPNKVTLQIGAATQISRMVANRRKPVEVNGKTLMVRENVGKVRQDELTDGGEYEATAPAIDDDDGPTFVDVMDKLALHRAEQYLAHVVPGYIRERLVIIAANGGDVDAAADKLRDAIDDILRQIRE